MNLDDRTKEELRREEIRRKIIFGSAILLVDAIFVVSFFHYYDLFTKHKSGILSILSLAACLLIFNKRLLIDVIRKKK